MKSDKYIYPGAEIGVLGLGITGRAAVRYALAQGATVYVSETRRVEELSREETELVNRDSVVLETGGHTEQFLGQVDTVLVSPGVDLHQPLLRNLRSKGVEFVGELAIAADKLQVPVVAITGTNGKTTVTTLIGDILRSAGKRVFVGGNIGTPLYELLRSPDDCDVVVLEVSSFQLESAGKFRPDVGLLLNISPDHLDRHGSMHEYEKTKLNLFKYQTENDICIVEGDNKSPVSSEFDIEATIQTFGFGKDCTARIVGQKIILTHDLIDESYDFHGGCGLAADMDGFTGLNYCAAILAARSLGCSKTEIEAGFAAFIPLPHRLQFVDSIEDITFYNDSKATNTGAVIAALETFEKRVILIAGGRDKGDDYTLLKPSVREKVKLLLVIGEAATLLKDALQDVVPILEADSMEDGVQQAFRQAQPGDVVLLSPACASFDMFRSYGHRGEEFQQAVFALKEGIQITAGKR